MLISILAPKKRPNRIIPDLVILCTLLKMQYVLSEIFPRIRYESGDCWNMFLHVFRLCLPIPKAIGRIEGEVHTWQILISA
jgi:hypothetical protein